MEVVRDKRL